VYIKCEQVLRCIPEALDLTSGYRIYIKLAKIKLCKIYGKIIYDVHNCFRKGRSCEDGYPSLKLLITKWSSIYKHGCHLQISKNPSKKSAETCYLKSKMTGYRTNKWMQYKIYKKNFIAVKFGTKYSEWKWRNQGGNQDCSLSPLLLVMYMKDMIRKWRLTSHSSVTIINSKSDTSLFTNDQVILEKSKGSAARFMQGTTLDLNMVVSTVNTNNSL
jgi:hypothetical protein